MEKNLIETLAKTMENRDKILAKLEQKQQQILKYYAEKIEQLEEKCDPNIVFAINQRKAVESFYAKSIQNTKEYFLNKTADIKDKILLDKETCSKYSIATLKKILVGEKGTLFLSPAHQILTGQQEKQSFFDYVYEGNVKLTFQVDFSTNPDNEGFSETYFIKTVANLKTPLLDGSLFRDHLNLIEDKTRGIALFVFDENTPSLLCLNPDNYIKLTEEELENLYDQYFGEDDG